MRAGIDWAAAREAAQGRLERLSEDDKLAIALAEFDRVSDPDVVPFVYADGPNGVRDALDATAFPATLALAASFDRELAAEYGRVVAGELIAAGKNALLGPAMDIARVPHSGRAGENLGEDPVLAGEIGGTVVRQLQAEGVLAVVKHYVANNFEWLRTGSGFPSRSDAMDVHLDPRTLTDIYLEPFRRAVCGYGAAALMGSYNRVNGEYVCQSRDLLALPRERWGWAGVTLPDFLFAVRDPAAALAAGLDVPGLDGASGRTAEHLLADRARLDEAVLHILTAAEAVGLKRPQENPAGLGQPEALELAERIAVDGMVLLKNDGDLLPLAASTRVAVIGAEVVAELLVIGGSAAVVPPGERITPAHEALAARLPVVSVPGVDGVVLPPVLAADAAGVIRVSLRDLETGSDRALTLDRFDLSAPEDVRGGWSAVAETRITPTRAGRHVFGLEFAGQATLFVEGEQVATGFREASPFVAGPLLPLFAVVELEAHTTVDVRVEYTTGVAISIPIPGSPITPHLRLGWSEPDDRIARAAAAAAEADVAVVIAGRVSGEGMDVDGLRLPGLQDDLIAAVAAANPRTIVVTLGAGPLVLPWLDRVPVVLHGWFPGERFAEALAALLVGEAEPGGRLVITWPAAEDATPIQSAQQYPGVDGVAEYTEGGLVGYRWYDVHGVEPAFAFGHGLSYAVFELSDHTATIHDEQAVFEVTVRNSGERPGKAVVQAYVHFPVEADQPPQQLKAFQVVRLGVGEERRIRMEVPVDDLACSDASGSRRVVPGPYRVAIGLSSRDLRGTASFDLAPH